MTRPATFTEAGRVFSLPSAVLFFFLPTVELGRQFDAIKTYVCFSQNVRIFSRKHTYVLMKT
jgi:hypothetical protein